MLRVSSPELCPECRIGSRPEAPEISSDSEGASGWREEVNNHRHAPAADTRGVDLTEELLETHREHGDLDAVIL